MVAVSTLSIATAATVVLLSNATGAWACPYDAIAPVEAATADESIASHVAHGAELIGGNCSYTTGLMARRVLGEGRDWQYVGEIDSVSNNLTTHVAAPFRTRSAGPASYLVATELLERLVTGKRGEATLELVGRSLEIDGVVYVVLTSFRVINS